MDAVTIGVHLLTFCSLRYSPQRHLREILLPFTLSVSELFVIRVGKFGGPGGSSAAGVSTFATWGLTWRGHSCLRRRDSARRFFTLLTRCRSQASARVTAQQVRVTILGRTGQSTLHQRRRQQQNLQAPAVASTAELFLEDRALYGIGGIAFLNGTLYVNNVSRTISTASRGPCRQGRATCR